jgi:hypothetical protein
MSSIKISDLPVSTLPLVGDELIPIVQGGVTKQTPISSFSSTLSEFSQTLSEPGQKITTPVLAYPPNYPANPDPNLAYKPSQVYEGGQTKFGKWRTYHNVAEWGWGVTYNAPIDPYSLFPWNLQPDNTQLRDTTSDQGASACVAMRFNVAEGTSGGNFWGIEWAPSSTTKTKPDWVWGPQMYFYQGDGSGTSTAGGLLRIISSAGRESALVLDSSNTATKKVILQRTTVDGSWQLQDITAFNFAIGPMPQESDGLTRIDVSRGTNKTNFSGEDVIALYGHVKIGDNGSVTGGTLTCTGNIGFNGKSPLADGSRTTPADATDLASTIALVNQLKAILKNTGIAL